MASYNSAHVELDDDSQHDTPILEVHEVESSKRRWIKPVAVFVILFAIFVLVYFLVMDSGSSTPSTHYSDDENIRAVQMFQNYLKVRTDQPNPDYTAARDFLVGLAKHFNLEHEVVEVSGLPTVIFSWKTQQDTSTVVFLSHMDVVLAEDSLWTYPPFSGYMEPGTGNIYGRGAQDTKCVGMQHLNAFLRVKAKGGKYAPYRHSIRLMYTPNEETAGIGGVQYFINTTYWQNLHVKFTLDEGVASGADSDVYKFFYTQRTAYQVNITTYGNPGHGSSLPPDTAATRMTRILEKAMAFRQEQVDLMKANNLTLGHVTSLNANWLLSGVTSTYNVIPSNAMLGLDIRITPGQVNNVTAMVRDWAASENASLVERFGNPIELPATSIDPSNPWFATINEYMTQTNRTFITDIFSGGADGNYIRGQGIPVYSFSPMIRTPPLAHANDEYLNNMTYLAGIDFYEDIMPLIADTDDN